MDIDEFNQKLKQNPLPMLVDVWAPWCIPCRSMQPNLEKLQQDYQGKVDVLQINADENKELIQSLKIFGVPTILGYQNQQQIFRRTGSHSQKDLLQLFEVLLGQQVYVNTPARIDRLIRSLSGITLLILGWIYSNSWLLMGLGAILLFSAFYDRCPIYRTITAALKGKFPFSHQG